MGEPLIGFDSPLAPNDKERIISIIAKEPENVRGTFVARLVHLVEIAFTSLELEFGSANDFGVTSEEEFAKFGQQVEDAVLAFYDAAIRVAALMPDDEADQAFVALLETHPWLANIAHFDGVVSDRFTSQHGSPAAAVRAAAKRLTALELRPEAIAGSELPGRRGRKPFDDLIRPVVRAVAVYCQTDPKLVFERSWPAGPPAVENMGKRGGAMQPAVLDSAPTRTVELIEIVLRALGIEFARKTVRTHLKKYAAELAGRPPRIADAVSLRILDADES